MTVARRMVGNAHGVDEFDSEKRLITKIYKTSRNVNDP